MHQRAPERFGNYLLHERIGAGGMAEIFLATAAGLEGHETELVIKKILPSLSDDEQFVKMFIEEAQLCVFLRHPNVVQVYDLGEIDEQYFIAMEHVAGQDLLKTLAACAKQRVAFPTDLALYIVMEVLKGLDYAHNLKNSDGQPLGIIHRDVSPSNVLLSYDGEVKISDFGIAKATIREKTATGILKGKFGYMAPEQVTGVPIDHRADVFAVGILLYEMLTGHRLFAGRNDLAVLERVRDARIDPPPRHYRPDLANQLEFIVLKALARDANNRFQSTAELHDALYDYTFQTGVVLGPRILARFMHEIFLRDQEDSLPWASSVHSVAPMRRSNPAVKATPRNESHTSQVQYRYEASTTDAGSDPGTPLRTSQVEQVYEDEPEDVTREESGLDAHGSSPWAKRPPALESELRRIQQAHEESEETDLDLEGSAAVAEGGVPVPPHHPDAFGPDGGTPMGGVPVVNVARSQPDEDPSMFETMQGEEEEIIESLAERTSLSNVMFRPGTESPSELEMARREFANQIGRAIDDDEDLEDDLDDSTEALFTGEDDELEMAEPDDFVSLDGPEDTIGEAQSPISRMSITASEVPEAQAVAGVEAAPLGLPPTETESELVDSAMPTSTFDSYDEGFGPAASDTIRGADAPGFAQSTTDGGEEPRNVTVSRTQNESVDPFPDPADQPSGNIDGGPSFSTIHDDDEVEQFGDGVFSTIQEDSEDSIIDETEGVDLDEIVRALDPDAPAMRTGGSAAVSRVGTELEDEPLEPETNSDHRSHDLEDRPSGGRIESVYTTAAAVSPPNLKPRPVLHASDDEDEIPPTSRSSAPNRRPRKKVSAAPSEIDVVNPPRDPKAHLDEPTSRGDLLEKAEIARASTAFGSFEAEPLVVPQAPDNSPPSTGVRLALSESQQVDLEIEEIRRSSGININDEAPDEKTALGDLAPLLGDQPTREAPLQDLGGGLFERFSSEAEFDDDEETRKRNELAEEGGARPPPITSAGRLDDRGASDLFGALSLIDGERQASFDPDEEASLEATAAETESPASRVEIMAPSVRRSQEIRIDSSERPDSFTYMGDLAGADRPVPRAPSLSYRAEAPEDDEDGPTRSVNEEVPSNVPVRSASFPAPSASREKERSMSLHFEDELSDGGYNSYDGNDDETAAFPEDEFLRAPSVINDPASRPDSFDPRSELTAEESDEFDRYDSNEPPAGLLSDSFAMMDGPGGARRSKSRAALRKDSVGNDIVALPGTTRDYEAEDVPPTYQRASSVPMVAPSASAERRSQRPAARQAQIRKVVERVRPIQERSRIKKGADTRQSNLPEATATGYQHAPSRSAPGEPPPPELPAEALLPVERRGNRLVTFLVPMAVGLVVLAGILFAYRQLTNTEPAPKPIPPSSPAAELARRGTPEPTRPAEAATPPGETPAEAQPGEAKPDEAKPDEAKPGEAKPDDPKPALIAPKPEPKEAAPAPSEAKPKRKAKSKKRRRASRRRAKARPKPKPKAAAKPTPKRKAKPKPKRAAKPKRKTKTGDGTIKIKCQEPAQVRIAKLKTFKGVTNKAIDLPPGGYRVIIRRADGSVTTSSVKVLAGQATRVPCD